MLTPLLVKQKGVCQSFGQMLGNRSHGKGLGEARPCKGRDVPQGAGVNVPL